MLGAIIGDIAGSYYEVVEVNYWKKYKKPRPYSDRVKILDDKVVLFGENSSCTDDSILTCAIYDALKNGNGQYEEYLRRYGLRELKLGYDQYGRSRFGKGFESWLKGSYQGDSYGNGAAMRVSPIGFCFDSLEKVKEESKKSCVPSHNHEDAIKGAEAVAVSIFLLRNGMEKKEVEKYIKDNYYSLGYDLEDLQRNYVFSSKSSDSVPQALYVFFCSNNFEDSIRKAISIGGDSDTIACIVGSLAEACYGIDDKTKEAVVPYMRPYMISLFNERYFSDIKVLKKSNN